MTDDTVTPVDIDDNLDDFEDQFYQRTPKAKEPEEKVEEEIDEAEEEVPEDDPLATEDEKEAEEDAEDDPEEDPEPEPKPKPKNKTQERIEKLVAKTREQERREAELIRRIEELEAPREVKPAKDARELLPADAPNPDALDADGEPIYALGEFDPKFIRDLTKFTIAEETKVAREAEKAAREQEQLQATQKELADEWTAKLDKYEEIVPEIRDNIRELEDTFADIEGSYGEYLALTIMGMDAGPEIMNYLAQNIGEAQKIVASGPAAATLALGRLDARLAKAPEESKRDKKRVSTAQEPPVDRTRGRGAKFATSGDTDDLDAFEKEFFKKR